ncbi:hypothetical protein ACYX34_16350 [Nitrospira sp. CMX1]
MLTRLLAVEEKNAEAKFKDGVLNLHLAKSEQAKSKAIEVDVA